jgi:hypothetical protein
VADYRYLAVLWLVRKSIPKAQIPVTILFGVLNSEYDGTHISLYMKMCDLNSNLKQCLRREGSSITQYRILKLCVTL